MLQQGDRVVVGVSGGADSMLLLHMLLELKDTLGISVEAAHIEHGIRGEESLADAEFVKEYCGKNGVAFHMIAINAVEESKAEGISVEEYSRKRRYEFFSSLGCDKIATAHNLDDSIETVLFHLARGTGLKGVCGIPPVRGSIIRPLIELTSSQIRVYCDKNSIEYRVDSTNADSAYSRNRIRNKIIPQLAKINASYQSAFADFISDSQEDYDFIESYSDSIYNDIIENDSLKLSALKELDIAVSKRIVIRYFASYGITLDRLHLNAVCALINDSGKTQIKGSLYAVSANGFLRLADLTESETDFEKIVINVLNVDEFNADAVDFYCDYDKIDGKAEISPRREGDSFSPANRNCTKTVKKLFNELGIPVEKRNTIPIIRDSSGVIGIAGICCDERVKADSSTKKVFTIKLPTED
jgi:tRNA(Ile)-lysidine synthase